MRGIRSGWKSPGAQRFINNFDKEREQILGRQDLPTIRIETKFTGPDGTDLHHEPPAIQLGQ